MFVNNFMVKLNLVLLLVKYIFYFLLMWIELYIEEVEVGIGNVLLFWYVVWWDYLMYKVILIVN